MAAISVVLHITVYSGTPPITDTIETQHFVPYSEVSLTQGLLYISGRRGVRNPAVDNNVAAFFELYFAVRWQRRLSRG